MLYPLDQLPMSMTPGERDAIQCAHLWLHSYSVSEALPPPSSQPTYLELWYMLKYFQQIQIFVNTLPSNFDAILGAHAIRYTESMTTHMPAGARCLSYREVRQWPVAVPLALIASYANAAAGLDSGSGGGGAVAAPAAPDSP